MILPGSYFLSLILLLLSLICLGSWANSLKMAGSKWRFELYYYDFTLGAFVAAVIIAFTFGSLGLDGFTLMDDLKLAGKRQDAFAFVAGAIFNLGNLLIVAAISLGGMAVALPVGLGLALIVGSALGYFMNPGGSIILLAVGCAAVLGGITFNIMAFRQFSAMKAQAAAAARAAAAAELAASQTAPAAPVRSRKPGRKKATAGKVLLLAILGGILAGVFHPLLSFAQVGENGLGPYSAAMIFTIGMLMSTFVYNLFFMNLPVQGAAVDLGQYFVGSVREHASGAAGGVIFYLGMLFAMIVTRAEGTAHVGTSLTTAATQGALVLGAVWGLVVWKEFDGAESNVRLWLGVMLGLLLVGIGVVSVASLYGVVH